MDEIMKRKKRNELNLEMKAYTILTIIVGLFVTLFIISKLVGG